MNRPDLTRRDGAGGTSPRTALLSAAAAMMLGSLCPWATVFGLVSASGVAMRLGWITLVAGAAILWLTLRPGRLTSQRRRIALTAAVLGALSCLLVIVGLSQSTLGTSWGVYFTLVGCLVAGYNARRVLT